jgi:hypothetical protein
MAESLNVKPPPWLEFLISRVVPPACREHVLGDFSERYTSPRQYAADALRTLPFVIAGQIRRTSDSLGLLMCVIPAFVFFGGLRSPDVVGSMMWLRALAPTMGVAIAMLLRSAYRKPDSPSSRQAVVDAAAAGACVLMLGQAVMRSQPVLALRAFGLILLLGALIRQLNQRGARRLQQKIDRLMAALEQQQ